MDFSRSSSSSRRVRKSRTPPARTGPWGPVPHRNGPFYSTCSYGIWRGGRKPYFFFRGWLVSFDFASAVATPKTHSREMLTARRSSWRADVSVVLSSSWGSVCRVEYLSTAERAGRQICKPRRILGGGPLRANPRPGRVLDRRLELKTSLRRAHVVARLGQMRGWHGLEE